MDLPGTLSEVIFVGYLEINNQQDYREVESPSFIKGATAKMKTYKSLNQFCRKETLGGKDRLVFFKMPPSFTCIVKTKQNSAVKEAVQYLNNLTENVTSADLSR